ncbi:helix-turn-helix domain-containing protein [Halovivax gelatinilyticus]|uniref:helix-turn-helix domain-containing protein n=1 Tax=Halovivax gelatinilyticus TaxID=2961597 RepID=UPI00272E1DFD|nr:helix-turn-helix domain-containing protein [Halovivax gelatinilyticus]
MSTPHSPTDLNDSGHLRARFRIEPDPKAGCGVVAAGERGDRVTQSLGAGGEDCDSRCHAEVDVADEGARLLSSDVSRYCICPVFQGHDCVASVDSLERGELVVTVSVASRDEFRSIVDSLREREASVRLLRVSRSVDEAGGVERALEIETSAITDKQREAVRMAVEAGYYETPRRTDLGELAERLGISKSAVSQRLTAVETRLVAGLVDADGSPVTSDTS